MGKSAKSTDAGDEACEGQLHAGAGLTVNPKNTVGQIRLDQNRAVAYKGSYAAGLRVCGIEDGGPAG